MEFSQAAIAALAPATRVEIQEYYVRRFLARRTFGRPERRAPMLAQLPRIHQLAPAPCLGSVPGVTPRDRSSASAASSSVGAAAVPFCR